MNDERSIKLASARQMVTIDETILDGTPVVGGTRIPVRDVAAMLREASPAEVAKAFPALSLHQIELCGIYAEPSGRGVRRDHRRKGS